MTPLGDGIGGTTGFVTTMEGESVDDGIDYQAEWTWKPFTWTWSVIFHFISAILGLIGNLLVMLALFKRRGSARSTDRLIGALALADFLTSIFVIPVPRENTVPSSPLGHFYCKMVLPGFPLFVSFTSSIYILMAISLERYIAVIHPIIYNKYVTRKKTFVATILLIWASAILVYSVFIVTVVTVDPVHHRCNLHYSSSLARVVMGTFFLTYRLLFPASVMLVTQIKIASNLHRRSARYARNSGVSFHMKARNNVIKLTLIVIIVYIICWGPGQIAFFLYTVGAVPDSFIGSRLHTFVIVLTSYNSCVNPIIYTAWYEEFRVVLKQLFRCTDGSTTAPIFGTNKSPSQGNDERHEVATNI